MYEVFETTRESKSFFFFAFSVIEEAFNVIVFRQKID